MMQIGFFDLLDRYVSLDARRDPLVEIDAVAPWEEFRPALERVWRKPDEARKSRAGHKPMDAVLMVKTLVLSALYNLSDDQIEYQVRDRLSFMRFLGLGLEDRVPDAKEKRAKVGDALRGGISWRCSDAVDSLPRKGYATCQRLPSPSCPIHRVIHPTPSPTSCAMGLAS